VDVDVDVFAAAAASPTIPTKSEAATTIARIMPRLDATRRVRVPMLEFDDTRTSK
jgi:hypothetical protein